jgi:hypothetical protein
MRTSLLGSAVLSLSLTLPVSALVGCQQLADDLGGGAGSDASVSGSVCVGGENSSGVDGLPCCLANGEGCSGDYDCCDGLCSGGACASSGSTSCSAALGSRCATVATCGCSTDDDCCQEATGAVCSLSAYTSPSKRCCLNTGIPCGGDADCCSGTCDPAAATCD